MTALLWRADSATSFAIGQIYEHANKVVNLVKGLPIGVMTCGAGGIGNRFDRNATQRFETAVGWARMTLIRIGNFDLKNYTMEAVNLRVHEFFSEKVKEADLKSFFMLRVCGYSAGRPLPEVWQVAFLDGGKAVEVPAASSRKAILDCYGTASRSR